MSSRPLSIEISESEGIVTVSLTGDVGYTEATPFREALRAANERKTAKIVVDLSKVDYMNTPGLATLVEALQNTKRRSATLVLCGLTPKVRAIFDIAQLHRVFTIAADQTAAAAI